MDNRAEHEDEPPSLLDPETLQTLLRHLESTDIDELEIVQGDSRVYLRREPGHDIARLQDQERDGVPSEPGFAITAPLTGVFYGRASPEQPAFVSEGDAVEPGQVVALIETMKLFNEVMAELPGVVTRITVADHDLVELGQALMYIRPIDTSEPE